MRVAQRTFIYLKQGLAGEGEGVAGAAGALTGKWVHLPPPAVETPFDKASQGMLTARELEHGSCI